MSNFIFTILRSLAPMQLVLLLLLRPLHSQRNSPTIGYQSTEQSLQALRDILVANGLTPRTWPAQFYKFNATPCSTPQKTWSSIAFDTIDGSCQVTLLDISTRTLGTMTGSQLPIQRVMNVVFQFKSLQKLTLCNFFEGFIAEIPIGALPSLTNLKISDSPKVIGTVPTSIGALLKLQLLTLTNNSLYGNIPEQLGNCKTLKKIDLCKNKLSGIIPISICSLLALTSLALNDNVLSGSIPSLMGELTGLNDLYLQNNTLSGSLPTTLRNLRSLRVANLSNNTLVGHIPTEVGLLSDLRSLSLGSNSLSGPIPSTLGIVGWKLSILALSNNQLTGLLPTELRNLTGLNKLILNNNFFHGILPDIFDGFTNLKLLHLHANSFTGWLPSSLLALTKLETLLLSQNDFIGHLNAGKLFAMKHLDAQNNRFEGKLPNFCSASKVVDLDLANNRFSGQIPVSLASLSFLKTLNFGNNRLNGSLFPALFGLRLVSLDVIDNIISSTIPTEIGLLVNATNIRLGRNLFTGAIPSQLGNLVNLEVLDIRTCRLSGTIPTQLGLLTNLRVLNISKNFLVGQLPEELGGLLKLLQLSAYSNKLTGELPKSLATLSVLEQAYLYNNSFNGSVDIFFSNGNFPALSYLDLSSNTFSGPLVMTSVSPKLEFVSLMLNCFSGKIDIAQLCQARLVEFIMFDGLSDHFSCQSSKFLWGEKGGLVAKSKFEKYFGEGFGWQFNSYARDSLHGTIPGCIFVLPNITSVHFTGLGLHGSLPQEYKSWSTSLNDISIAYNRLGNKIPEALLRAAAHLETLDLSYNRFRGSLENIMPQKTNTTTLNLHLNYLSGPLPPTVIDFQGKLNILEGNLFECKSSSALPAADKNSGFYSCGSDQFNYALYSTVSAFLLTVAFFAFQISQGRFTRLINLMRMSSRVPGGIFRKVGILSDAKQHPSAYNEAAREIPKVEALHTEAFIILLSNFSSISGFIGINIVVVLMMVYASLKFVENQSFSMYKEQYAWTVAAIFLTGVTPAIVLTSVWSLFLIFPLVWFYRKFYARLTGHENARLRRSADALLAKSIGWDDLHRVSSAERPRSSRNPMLSPEYAPEESPGAPTYQSRFVKRMAHASRQLLELTVTLRLWLRLIIICCIYCIAALAVNVGYVYLYVFGNVSRKYQIMLQIGVAGIKLALRNLSPVLSRSPSLRLGLRKNEVDNAPAYLKTDEGIELLLTLFGSLIAPLVATAATDHTCFYSVIKGNDPISMRVAYSSLSIHNEEALSSNLTISSNIDLSQSFSERSFDFLPPFVYTYQCSSSLVRVYAPPLLMVGLLKTFLFPFAAYFGRVLLYFCHRRKTIYYHSKTLAADSTISDSIMDDASEDTTQPPAEESTAKERLEGCDENEAESPFPQPISPQFYVDPDGQKISPVVSDSAAIKAAAVKAALHEGGRKMLDMVMICLIAMTPKLLQKTSERKMYQKYVASNKISSLLGQFEKYVLRTEADRDVEFVDSKRIILDAIIDLLVLLTFGVVCPLLALVYILAIYCRCTRWMYMIVTFVSREDAEACILLNLDCARAWKRQKNLIFRLRWLIVICPSLFLSFFVIDVAASAGGLTSTYWLPILMSTIPATLAMALRKSFPTLFRVPLTKVVHFNESNGSNASVSDQSISNPMVGEPHDRENQTGTGADNRNSGTAESSLHAYNNSPDGAAYNIELVDVIPTAPVY